MDFDARQNEELDDELERECQAMQQREPMDILEPDDYRHALAQPELPRRPQ